MFFADLEPAVAFGRAGRMSGFDISGYTVFPAAHEVRFDVGLGRDVRVLHVQRSRRHPPGDERAVLTRWLDGVDPTSAHYRPTTAEPSP